MENDEPIESSLCDLIRKSCGKIQLVWFSALYLSVDHIDPLLLAPLQLNNDTLDWKLTNVCAEQENMNVFVRLHSSMTKPMKFNGIQTIFFHDFVKRNIQL